MRIKLGKPTEYGYILTKNRYKFCKTFINLLDKKINILNFGCGNGANTILFKNNFKNITGIDVKKEYIDTAKTYISKKNIKNIKYLIYNGLRIPVSNEYFDCAVSFEVLEHVNNDIKSLIELNRVLKTDALLFISVPNKWYLMETHGFNSPLSNIIPYNRIPFLNLMPKTFYNKFGNARIYTKKEIIKKLLITGFEPIHLEYLKLTFDIVKNQFIKSILRYVYALMPPFMGCSIICAARKKNSNINPEIIK